MAPCVRSLAKDLGQAAALLGRSERRRLEGPALLLVPDERLARASSRISNEVEGANAVMSRLHDDFASRFPTTVGLRIDLGFERIDPGKIPTAKEVLPRLFGPNRGTL